MATFPSDSVRTKNWITETLTDSDQEGQLDLLHNYIKAMLDASTGHTHDGTSNQGPKIPANTLTIASQATGDLLYASSASAWARLAKGTASQFFKMKSDASLPEYSSGVLWTDLPNGAVVQVVNVQTGAVGTGSTTTPNDDTIPAITEGNEILTTSYTPLSATNKLKFTANITVIESTNTGAAVAVALHQGGVTNALCVSTADASSYVGSSAPYPTTLIHYMTAPGTSAYTFSIRAGCDGGPVTWNGVNSGRKYGGVLISSLTIEEIKA